MYCVNRFPVWTISSLTMFLSRSSGLKVVPSLSMIGLGPTFRICSISIAGQTYCGFGGNAFSSLISLSSLYVAVPATTVSPSPDAGTEAAPAVQHSAQHDRKKPEWLTHRHHRRRESSLLRQDDPCTPRHHVPGDRDWQGIPPPLPPS